MPRWKRITFAGIGTRTFYNALYRLCQPGNYNLRQHYFFGIRPKAMFMVIDEHAIACGNRRKLQVIVYAGMKRSEVAVPRFKHFLIGCEKTACCAYRADGNERRRCNERSDGNGFWLVKFYLFLRCYTVRVLRITQADCLSVKPC